MPHRTLRGEPAARLRFGAECLEAMRARTESRVAAKTCCRQRGRRGSGQVAMLRRFESSTTTPDRVIGRIDETKRSAGSIGRRHVVRTAGGPPGWSTGGRGAPHLLPGDARGSAGLHLRRRFVFNGRARRGSRKTSTTPTRSRARAAFRSAAAELGRGAHGPERDIVATSRAAGPRIICAPPPTPPIETCWSCRAVRKRARPRWGGTRRSSCTSPRPARARRPARRRTQPVFRRTSARCSVARRDVGDGRPRSTA